MLRSAMGARSCSRCAISRTRSWKSASGKTPDTRLSRSASCASMMSPSRYSSRALAGPTMRGNVHVPPKSPDSPAVPKAVRNFADSAA